VPRKLRKLRIVSTNGLKSRFIARKNVAKRRLFHDEYRAVREPVCPVVAMTRNPAKLMKKNFLRFIREV
jgi:hypothetical protein